MRWTSRTPMLRRVLLACALLGAACSSKEDPPSTDARQADGPAGGNPDAPAGGGPEVQFETGSMSGTPRLCGEIRNCVVHCLGDAACAQACVAQAPPAAQAKYQEVTTCSKGGCAEDDTGCRCERECLEPGPCVSLVDECRDGIDDDTFCDELCH